MLTGVLNQFCCSESAADNSESSFERTTEKEYSRVVGQLPVVAPVPSQPPNSVLRGEPQG